jgi:hypothetical protein
VPDEQAAEALPDGAFVIRGGVMNLEDLRTNVDNHYDMVLEFAEREEWALSVNSIPGLKITEVAVKAQRPNPKMYVSTVGRIRALGYEVRPDWKENGHSNIVFESEPSNQDLEGVKAVFRGPCPNPGRRERRR